MPQRTTRRPIRHRLALTQADARGAWARRPASALAVLSLLLGGCATVGPAPTAGAATAPAPAATPGAATAPAAGASAPAGASGAMANAPGARPPAAPGSPPPFAEVTRGAQRRDGFLPVWTKDDKTWLEVPAKLLDQPFFLGHSLASGLGEGRLWPGLMGQEQVVVLRRVGQSLQLVARNLSVRAPGGTPLARALADSYSDSLLASAPLAAAPHAEHKALLVDAQALLGGDLPGLQTHLESVFRLPYALDRANSQLLTTRTGADGTSLRLRAHFAVPKLPAPPAVAPPNPALLPSPPRTVPDARSLFVQLAYTLAPLPAQPMAPRRADARVGYFTEGWMDLGQETGGENRSHVIYRWRLDKKDPAAAVSPPVQPIRAVMDRNIPEKWRPAIRAGILEWNTAFERAGIRDAVVVEQQPDDADWESTEGTRLLAVRWFAMEGPGATAVGPSQVDPRSGEILRGAAIIPENWVRIGRTRIGEIQPPIGADGQAAEAPHAHPHAPGSLCTLASDGLAQRDFSFELLVARGLMDPTGPEADAYIAASLKDVTMHEVGHALGLRHNFKASTTLSPAQLRDAAYTAANGISASVMDYLPNNLPLQGEPRGGTIQMTQLGAYDLWAIEYGYRNFAPEQEAAGLAALLARRAKEPQLVYATDEDAAGPDPEANRFDLGADPLAYALRQTKLARELWQRTAERPLSPDDDFTLYRRNLERVLSNYRSVLPLAARYVGGLHTRRATAGDGVALLEPVSAQRQRQALDLVVGELFSTRSFQFDPALMSRLGIDQLDRLGPNRFVTNPDFSLAGAVGGLHRQALDMLVNDGLAARLADAETKVRQPAQLLGYAEVQQRVREAVWAELAPGTTAGAAAGQIDSLRRNLQREHVKRLAGGLLRPATGTSADAPAVHRAEARRLHAALKTALARPGWSALSRAHLEESLSVLDEALRAPLVRQGV